MTDLPASLDFHVRRDDWSQTRFVEGAVPELAPGQVLFRVDRFALTANNITYAAVGDQLGYWRFFPAAEGWGRLPVMGFGDVVRSRHEGVAVGTRCFGFYPMSRYLVIQPGTASAAQIVDAAPHREGLAPAYAQYTPSSGDPLYRPEHEDPLMLLRGLFLTGFLAEDQLEDRHYHGASRVLVSSASSKTAIALAHCIAKRGRAVAVGLTSPRNLEFVKKLGCYGEVVAYDAVDSLDPSVPSAYVDHAGDAELRRRIHTRLGDALEHSLTIGATHWDATGESGAALPGPQPEFFFAPAQIQKRLKDWGGGRYQQRMTAAWSDFQAFSEGWLEVRRSAGPEALERVYRETLEGRTRPEQGNVASLSAA